MNTGNVLDEPELKQLTERIIGCAYQVSNTLGTGFLEKVYENALAHELRKCELALDQQPAIKVWYDGVIVGDYYPDLVVEHEVVIELKAVKAIDNTHAAQCINALRATGHRVGLVLNFGTPRLGIKRLVKNL